MQRAILYSVPDGNWVRAEERVLWYSAQYRDWDLSNGTTPREVGTLGLFQWRFAFRVWQTSNCAPASS